MVMWPRRILPSRGCDDRLATFATMNDRQNGYRKLPSSGLLVDCLWFGERDSHPAAGDALMDNLYRYIEVDRVHDVFCVHLKHTRMEEMEIESLGSELVNLVMNGGCKLVLNLGLNSPSVLFSLFLAKLVLVHRRLLDVKGTMRLCAVNSYIMEVFQACQLDSYFEFAEDKDAAIAALTKKE
jgi:hypothetical protein